MFYNTNMNDVYKQLYTAIWKEVFPGFEPMEITRFKALYTQDLWLPGVYKSAIGGQDVYASGEYKYKELITPDESKDLGDNVFSKEGIASLKDLIGSLKEKKLTTFRGSRSLNSDELEESDDIYSSTFVYNSTHIFGSQKIMFSYGNRACEYLMACKGNGESSFGIRLWDSGSVSNSFDIHWCGKSANCYFCVDSYDLRDCMFCFHIKSKQYCIGNMQFEEAEYKQLKQMILTEYFAQLNSPNPFVTLRDL